ncbi:MAG TPA: dethiobiotin synthase [Cyclobacteriaceae bacterium]
MDPKRYFVTAIGTDSGKTIVSSILVEALKADYWKPIQCGYPRDTETVQDLVLNKISTFHDERYLLKTPASPHFAAQEENISISKNDFDLPLTDNHLVVEGAGGIMVPFNDHDYIIDIAFKLDLEIILVANLYLGSINHTLLSLKYLEDQQLNVKGLVFNGPTNPSSEAIILKKCKYPFLLKIDQQDAINQNVIIKYAKRLNEYGI